MSTTAPDPTKTEECGLHLWNIDTFVVFLDIICQQGPAVNLLFLFPVWRTSLKPVIKVKYAGDDSSLTIIVWCTSNDSFPFGFNISPFWGRAPHQDEGFQPVSLSDRDPRGRTGGDKLEVNPGPETNFTLPQTDRRVWRQTSRDPHGMINKYARTHRHTDTHRHTLPVGTSTLLCVPACALSAPSLCCCHIAAWPVLLPRLSSPITCSLSGSDRQGY